MPNAPSVLPSLRFLPPISRQAKSIHSFSEKVNSHSYRLPHYFWQALHIHLRYMDFPTRHSFLATWLQIVLSIYCSLLCSAELRCTFDVTTFLLLQTIFLEPLPRGLHASSSFQNISHVRRAAVRLVHASTTNRGCFWLATASLVRSQDMLVLTSCVSSTYAINSTVTHSHHRRSYRIPNHRQLLLRRPQYLVRIQSPSRSVLTRSLTR